MSSSVEVSIGEVPIILGYWGLERARASTTSIYRF